MKSTRRLICLLLVSWATPVAASELIVCPSCPLAAVQTAVQQASAGDTIRIRGGEYHEGTIVIAKPLTLIGTDWPVLDGDLHGNVLEIRADDVTVQGLHLQRGGSSDIHEFAGIRVEAARRCRILDNRLTDNVYSLYLAKAHDCVISGNQLTGNTRDEVSGGNGVHLWSCDHITLHGNTVSRHRDGLYLEFTSDSTIDANHSFHNIRYGMHFMFSPRNRYYRNRFSENQTGVAVMYSRQVEMKENRFEKSWGRTSYGLLLKDITDSVIEANTFAGNTIGLFADGATRNQIRGNRFAQNGWAANILGNSDGNVFEANDFVANYFHVATNSRYAINTFRNNYWSDYDGYDLDRDGWGDVPFRPMKIFSLWVNRYPELVALLGSPVVEFLEVAERVFPILTPKALTDDNPSMAQYTVAP